MNKLICMSFDGDYVTEGEFPSIVDAWERANDMGSRWYFYPFHFVTTASGKTIKDAPSSLEWAIGARVRTVAAIFKEHSEKPEMAGVSPEDFVFSL